MENVAEIVTYSCDCSVVINCPDYSGYFEQISGFLSDNNDNLLVLIDYMGLFSGFFEQMLYFSEYIYWFFPLILGLAVSKFVYDQIYRLFSLSLSI